MDGSGKTADHRVWDAVYVENINSIKQQQVGLPLAVVSRWKRHENRMIAVIFEVVPHTCVFRTNVTADSGRT